MSADDDKQTRLGEPLPTEPAGHNWDPHDHADYLREIIGTEPDHYGRLPTEIQDDLGPDDDWWRFQVEKELFYFVGGGPPGIQSDETEIAGIQWRAVIHTVNEPPLAIQNHLRRLQLHRIPTLFNTGKYEGHLEGYFEDQREAEPGENPPGFENPVNTENTDVGRDEAGTIGIVSWFFEIYDEDGNLRGKANGYLDPWVERGEEAPDAPQHVEWSVHWTPSRGTYEIRPPQGAGRKRLLGLSKKAYINGYLVGKTKPGGQKRGIVELKKEYKRRPTINGDQRPVDREFLKRQGMNAAEIRDGTKIYKISETSDSIHFVSAKRRLPSDWDPIAPDEISPGDTGAVLTWLDLVGDDEPTLFDIRVDKVVAEDGARPALGRYNTPTTREIVETTEFDFPQPP